MESNSEQKGTLSQLRPNLNHNTNCDSLLESPDFFQLIDGVLTEDEGDSETPYLDSKQNWTIGKGHYIGKNLADLKLSKAVRQLMLREDLEEALQIAYRIFTPELFCSWTNPRKIAMLSLIFNMGEGNEHHGFRSFKNMINAAKRGDWDEVAAHLKDSKWATDVDPKQIDGKGRDDRLIEAFRDDTLKVYKLG